MSECFLEGQIMGDVFESIASTSAQGAWVDNSSVNTVLFTTTIDLNYNYLISSIYSGGSGATVASLIDGVVTVLNSSTKPVISLSGTTLTVKSGFATTGTNQYATLTLIKINK